MVAWAPVNARTRLGRGGVSLTRRRLVAGAEPGLALGDHDVVAPPQTIALPSVLEIGLRQLFPVQATVDQGFPVVDVDDEPFRRSGRGFDSAAGLSVRLVAGELLLSELGAWIAELGAHSLLGVHDATLTPSVESVPREEGELRKHERHHRDGRPTLHRRPLARD